MKNPVQLNGDADWGNTPRQQNRFYSVYGGYLSAIKQADADYGTV